MARRRKTSRDHGEVLQQVILPQAMSGALWSFGMERDICSSKCKGQQHGVQVV